MHKIEGKKVKEIYDVDDIYLILLSVEARGDIFNFYFFLEKKIERERGSEMETWKLVWKYFIEMILF